MMSDVEAIRAVREGRRAVTDTSLLPAETPVPACDHRWRTVACDSETDVIECSRCGRQQLARCDFDEEYA